MGEGLCYNVFGARDMDNITGELKRCRQDGMSVWRTTAERYCERLMICEKGKLTGFEEETEMMDGGVSCKEFTIKGGVLGFGEG